jgi:hypothetical protein
MRLDITNLRDESNDPTREQYHRRLRALKAALMNHTRAGMTLRRLPSSQCASLPDDLRLWPTWE